MKQKLNERVAFYCDDEFKDAIARLENHHVTRGMSETIRRVIILAARKLPKEAVRR